MVCSMVVGATGSLRSFGCRNASSADSPEFARITRNRLPYSRRKSRSTARQTSASSSTVNKTDFARASLCFNFDRPPIPQAERRGTLNWPFGHVAPGTVPTSL
jgi:hypothetical protein